MGATVRHRDELRYQQCQLTSKLILHHSYNRTDVVLFRGHDFFNQQTSTLVVGGDESLFANVGSKLVAGHVQHLTTELGDHKRTVVGSPAFEDELHNIVLEMSR